MRMIDADTKITALLYDEEHEETNSVEMTIADFLDSHTEEGCPQNGGWVSVKDRLPDAGGIYFARLSDGQYKVLAFEESMGWYNDYEYGPLDVTHWMYLPEPPEEVSGDAD